VEGAACQKKEFAHNKREVGRFTTEKRNRKTSATEKRELRAIFAARKKNFMGHEHSGVRRFYRARVFSNKGRGVRRIKRKRVLKKTLESSELALGLAFFPEIRTRPRKENK